ncbi:MAG: hypothetical protein KAJ23_05455 [Maribacter sp.]|nr:hypothetical protein [Maribacter sp.]
MDYLKTITSIFEKHEISQYSELRYQKLTKSEKHPSSEGIIFESNVFAGEIFYYANGNMEYCEMEFLIFNREKYKYKLVEKLNLTELEKSMAKFLTERITELKTVRQ